MSLRVTHSLPSFTPPERQGDAMEGALAGSEDPGLILALVPLSLFDLGSVSPYVIWSHSIYMISGTLYHLQNIPSSF